MRYISDAFYSEEHCLEGADNYVNCTFTECKLGIAQGAYCDDVVFRNCIFIDTIITPFVWGWKFIDCTFLGFKSERSIKWEKCSWENCIFTGDTSLQNGIFTNSKFTDVMFAGTSTDFTNAVLIECKMTRVISPPVNPIDFSLTEFTKVSVKECNFSYGIFSKAQIKGGSYFADVSLKGANLNSVTINRSSLYHVEMQNSDCRFMHIEQSSMNTSDISGSNFILSFMRHANFTNVNAVDVDFSSSSFQGNFTQSSFIGSDFTSANTKKMACNNSVFDEGTKHPSDLISRNKT